MLSYQRPNLNVCASCCCLMSASKCVFCRVLVQVAPPYPAKPEKKEPESACERGGHQSPALTASPFHSALLNMVSKRSDKVPVCVIPPISTSSDTTDLSLTDGKLDHFSWYVSRCGPLCHQSMRVNHVVISQWEWTTLSSVSVCELRLNHSVSVDTVFNECGHHVVII